MENWDEYYKNKYKYRPLKKWLYVRKLKKEARNMESNQRDRFLIGMKEIESEV